jgi:hypothetical protein
MAMKNLYGARLNSIQFLKNAGVFAFSIAITADMPINRLKKLSDFLMLFVIYQPVTPKTSVIRT